MISKKYRKETIRNVLKTFLEKNPFPTEKANHDFSEIFETLIIEEQKRLSEADRIKKRSI